MDNVGKPKDYALSGKIMLIAIVILFIVIIIMLCLHVYIRWYLVRARRSQILRRARHSHSHSRRRPQFVFLVNPATLTLASRGLNASVISSLPVFAFSTKTHSEAVQCAVCLSEFEEGETGRVLPRCNHTFHIDCIDMWFQSHTTCPLCRAPVEPPPETRPEVTVTVCEPESGSSSSGCCQYEGEEPNRTGPAVSSSTSSSTGFAEKKRSTLVGVTVEVPGRNETFGDESQSSSFWSPRSRMLSFKRILSRERKARVSDCVVGCSSMAELDAERGDSVS